MILQGISFMTAAVAAVGASLVIVALHFLKSRYRNIWVCSVMLWREAAQVPRRSVLWRKLTNYLQLLLLLTLVMSLLAALTEPVWGVKPVRKTVVVAVPEAIEVGYDHANKLDPLHTAFIVADSAPIIVRNFSDPVVPVTAIRTGGNGVDISAALQLASLMAGRNGRIVFLGPNTPPWLPAGTDFIKVNCTVDQEIVPEVSVFLNNASEGFSNLVSSVPGIISVPSRSDADFIYASENVSDERGVERQIAALYEKYEAIAPPPQGLQNTTDESNHVMSYPAKSICLVDFLFALSLLLASGYCYCCFQRKY